jgi:hypothetical protein
MLKYSVEIIQRLRPVHGSRLLASLNGRCAKDTREDILQEINAWVANTKTLSSVCWIRGKMGTGKTAIVRTIADRLKDQGLLGCAYFVSRDGASTDPRRMIQTMTFELSNTFPGLRSTICAGIMALGDFHTASLVSMVRVLLAEPLRQLLRDHRPVVFILDNLPRAYKLHSSGVNVLVRSLITGFPQGTKMIISGVDDGTTKLFSDLLPPSICTIYILHKQLLVKVSNDVNTFYRQQLGAVIGERPSADDQNWLASTTSYLTDQTGHLFLFASIVARYVNAHMHSPRDRLKGVTAKLRKPTLATTSEVFEPLDVIYRLVLDDASIDGLDKHHPEVQARLKSLLGCIVVSNGQLSAKELAQALHLDEELVAKYTDVLSSILIVAPDGVRPFHPSLVDFLLDERRCTPKWAILVHATHLVLAGFCFDTMEASFTTSDRMAASLPNVAPRQSLQSSSSLHYACTHWAIHVASTGTLFVDVLTRTSRFCTDLILPWLEAICGMDCVDEVRRGLRSLREYISVSGCP